VTAGAGESVVTYQGGACSTAGLRQRAQDGAGSTMHGWERVCAWAHLRHQAQDGGLGCAQEGAGSGGLEMAGSRWHTVGEDE